MSQKYQTIALKSLNLLGLVLLCHVLGTHAKSIQRLKSANENDPIMALPSGRENQQTVQYVAYEQAAPTVLAQAEPRQEMAVEYQPQPDVQMTSGQYQAQPEQQYGMAQIQGQQQQQSSGNEQGPHSHGGVDCNQRHEFTAIMDQQGEQASSGGEQSADYPGQLVYVGQGNSGPDNLKGVAAAWSQATDLSATILTEIPVKDMPQEVLNKLRRDYGVKVVATRERPGANLVINCDEYSSQDNSICKRHLASHEADYRQEHNRPQDESTEARSLAPPRQQTHAFQHVEQVIRPMQQPVVSSHVYASEEQAENNQTGEDSRGGSANEQSSPAQPTEQAGYEGVMSEPAGGATHYESHASENDKETSSQAAGGQSGETNYATGGESQQTDQRVAPQEDKSRESYELASGFDEQQQKSD